MKLTGGLFLSQLESTGFFVISQPEPFVELLLDVAISDLFVDIRKAGFINFESFIAMGKNNAVYALFYFLNYGLNKQVYLFCAYSKKSIGR